MRLPLLALAVCLAAVAAVSVPVPSRVPAAPASPHDAAERAERELPSLGLTWGKLRGWERTGGGWTLAWQPAHGAWLLRAWIPDGAGDGRWRLDASPWLPGARLGREAARRLAGDPSVPALARDLVGRRDWLVGEAHLAGALPAGTALPRDVPHPNLVVEGILAGLLLAGAAVRRLVPGLASRFWRRTVTVVALAVTPAVPSLAVLAPQTFQAGVRPWVAELAFATAAVMLLGAVAFAARTFPATGAPPAAARLVLAASAGLLAGRLEPMPLVGAAVSPWRLPVWVTAAFLTGWLAALAGDGLRELLHVPPLLRSLLLAGLGVAIVGTAGPWLGLAVAVLLAAGAERGDATAVGVAAMWGWECGVVQAICEWDGALWDGLTLLAIGAAAVAVVFLASRSQAWRLRERRA